MVALGVERTIEQDPAFAVRIMVDIAIRALSPAVNDPTTAVQVLDHLEDLLRLVGQTDLSDEGTPLEEMDAGSSSRSAVGRLPDAERHRDPRVRRRVDPGRRRLRAMLEELSEAAPPSDATPCSRARAARRAVARGWGATVDVDLAGRSDRQGIGGPSGRRAS